MFFDREPLPRIQFKDNPLRVVIAQLRFPTEFGLAEPGVLARIQERLRQRYPVAQTIQQEMSLQFTVGGKAPRRVQEASPGPIRFIGDDGAWVVTLGPDVLSLETTAYHDWAAFRARFEEVLDAVTDEVTPTQVQRLGLRFIDELKHPEARTLIDWSRFIEPDLLGTAATEQFAGLTTRAGEQITLIEGDDAATITHAYTQSPRGADPPSTYVIDVDCFTAKAFALERELLRSKLERYHTAAWNLFRGNVRQPLIDALGRET